MNRHKALLAITMLARIAGGLASFLFLARSLGPADYGFVITILAYAAIAALVSDFGFSIKLLRDIGSEPSRAGELVAECLRAKTLIAMLASLAMLPALVWWQPGQQAFGPTVVLYLAVLVLSYGDLALVAVRALGGYAAEAWSVVLGNVLLVAALFLVALHPDLWTVALVLVAVRSLQAAGALLVLTRFVRLGNCLRGPVLRPLREASGLALDTVMTALTGQIDVVLVSGLLGFHAAGIYQVAARASAYALLPSQVLAGVYTPRLSAHRFRGEGDAEQLERRMRVEFPLGGAIMGIFVVALLPTLAPLVFGEAFMVPFPVWLGFGFLVFARFSIGALGIALVARRAVRARLLGQGLGMATLIAGMAVFLPTAGIVAAPWVVVAATAVTATIYALALKSTPQPTTASRWRCTAWAARMPR